jgi:hypothetical protein
MFAVLAAGLGALVIAGPLTVANPPSTAKPKAKIASSQGRILEQNAVTVTLSGVGQRVRLRARSETFDQPYRRPLTRAVVVRPNEPHGGHQHRAKTRKRVRVKLPLTAKGRRELRGCEAREITVRRTTGSADLERTTPRCKPKPIDLSRAETCDFIGQQAGSLCMLPFPDDFYTAVDPSSATGRRIDFDDAAMPQNADGTPIAAAPYELNDGFSPGQPIVVKVPDLDNLAALGETGPVPINHLGRYRGRRTPVVVIDAETHERHPIWVEIDSNSDSAVRAALLIHPAVNFASGHRYIVAMRKLKRGDGSKIPPPEGFRLYRDDLPSKKRPVKVQRKRFENVFRHLRKAGIRRSNLYLAWDFTVATDENIAARMLHIRDKAFATLGDATLADLTVQGAAPAFAVTQVESFTPAQNPRMARRVRGTFQVPCYLHPSCGPGGRFALGADGLPSRNGTWTANFNCMVPRAAVDDPSPVPARPQVYGHGLLGSANEAISTGLQTLGADHGFVICATDEIGMSSSDVLNIATNILPDLSAFPQLADRLQQGLLNELFLGRLLIHADGFVSHAAFHADGATLASPPVIDTSHVYYNGNSQGGILGGAAIAVGVDWDRGALGVPAMNYSVLLNRSIDFDAYKAILDPAYPDPLAQQLILSLIQMLWDRGEANGYAHRMTSSPLPNTPAHKVLMQVAFGDHQVTNFQSDVEARTIGASKHVPVLDPGRWPDVDVLWNVPPIESYPFTGPAAIFYGDIGPIRPDPADPSSTIGVAPPPLANVPNRTGEDPHGAPRGAPAAFQLVSDFLRPDGVITDVCGPDACHAGGWTGP